MNHILVPSDFSVEAEEATLFAISLAQNTPSDITVLYVAEIPTIGDPVVSAPFYRNNNYLETLRHAAMEKFKTFINQHTLYFKNIKLIVTTGSVTQSIVNYAAGHGVTSVVMGTKGATGLKEFFIGSNTEKVVRLSPVPVFTVRKALDVKEVKTILYPTSLELNNSVFMEKLKELQAELHAHLHLLFINTRQSFMNAEDVEEFIWFYDLTNVSYSLRNAIIEQEGIIGFVNTKKPDLLAMATHGRRGLAHLYTGSITEDVVNHINCPIWTSTMIKTEDTQLAKKEADAMNARRKRHKAEL